MKKLRGITGLIAIALAVTACGPIDENVYPGTPTPSATTTADATQEPEKEEETTEPEPEKELTLGADVEKALLKANAVEKFTQLETSSPGFAITNIEAINEITIRAHIQETLADDEAENTARWISQMSCTDVPDAETIVIRDASGTDRNCYAAKINKLPACN
ncbi:hypothetical protein [Timonella senegalensis]|uniref:hypothetical protein n=1 Tax=Timonella senegalensis TaxID=1465825 RepID=UPI0009DA5FDA|nr:hypothetical protein [Timonella senegalensis]